MALRGQPLGDVELTDEQLTAEIRTLAAVKLYEMGRASSGRAVELSGLPRIEFLDRLGRYNVSPCQTTREELKSEVGGPRADLGR
ncbi:MAG: UPF0175 family protein [Candidatus Latescibacteria bacterium]|jgi:predicted HTH domain antitoxin|nr:UPF0175 family protein [Planctomycetota bacterium]MDP6777229.1 UPF0175 family protein [Candidatus Latescibacterota bacterium]